MTNFNIEEKRGKVILHTGPMNGGKSLELIGIALWISYSKYKAVAFIPSIDVRSGDKISAIDGKMEYPAYKVCEIHPEDILRVVAEEDKKEKVDAIIIDEINFFHANIVRVVEKLRDKKRAVILGGLDCSFRGEPFWPTPLIKSIADEIYSHYPSCSIISNDARCSKPAKYTVRLIKTENEKEIIRFERKKGDVIDGYKWAPYYSPTIVVEGSQLDVAYTAVCPECFIVPRKKETLDVQSFITKSNGVDKKAVEGRFSDLMDLDKIVAFLLEEKRIVDKAGFYLPQIYVGDPFIAGNFIPVILKDINL